MCVGGGGLCEVCVYMYVYILLHFLRILQVLVQEFGLKVDIEFIMSLTTLLEAFSVKASDVSTPIGLIYAVYINTRLY